MTSRRIEARREVDELDRELPPVDPTTRPGTPTRDEPTALVEA
ncbi:hypothetical protein [Nocardia sp. NPDC051463]